MHHFHISNTGRPVTIEKPRQLVGGKASVSVYANGVQLNLYFKETQNADQFFCDMVLKADVGIARDVDRDSAFVTLNFHRITHCELEVNNTVLRQFSAYEADGAYHGFAFHYG